MQHILGCLSKRDSGLTKIWLSSPERQKTYRHLQQGEAPVSKPSLQGTFVCVFQANDLLHLLQGHICVPYFWTFCCSRKLVSDSTSCSRLLKWIPASFPTALLPAQPVEEVTATGLLTWPRECKYHLSKPLPDTVALFYIISIWFSNLH